MSRYILGYKKVKIDIKKHVSTLHSRHFILPSLHSITLILVCCDALKVSSFPHEWRRLCSGVMTHPHSLALLIFPFFSPCSLFHFFPSTPFALLSLFVLSPFVHTFSLCPPFSLSRTCHLPHSASTTFSSIFQRLSLFPFPSLLPTSLSNPLLPSPLTASLFPLPRPFPFPLILRHVFVLMAMWQFSVGENWFQCPVTSRPARPLVLLPGSCFAEHLSYVLLLFAFDLRIH